MNLNKGNVMMPVAVIVAGLIIAGAILFTNSDKTPVAEKGNEQVAEKANENNAGNNGNSNTDTSNLNPVDESDHILGSLDAPIKIVEFSDFECPFCGRVHPTLETVVEQYDGQVAWVYRHFPLSQIHRNANSLAQASECVAEFAGNDAFWAFSEGIFDGKVDVSTLDGISDVVAVDQAQVQSCVDSEKYKDEVAKDFEDGRSVGARGTPYAVVTGPNGQSQVISGAQPLSVWTTAIDQMLES